MILSHHKFLDFVYPLKHPVGKHRVSTLTYIAPWVSSASVVETAVQRDSSWYAASHVTHASFARKNARVCTYVRACICVCVFCVYTRGDSDVSMPVAYLHGTRSSPAVRGIYSSSFLLSLAAAFNAELSTTRKRRMTTTTKTRTT